MKLCLVACPTVTDFERASDAKSRAVRKVASVPQLGVLTLAAIAERYGVKSSVVSVNEAYYKFLAKGGCGLVEFVSWFVEYSLPHDADVYGMSSICSSYPLTIRIAEALKAYRADCTIVLGGPQASVVDLQTLNAFPFIDFVLRGEADQSLPLFLDECSGSRQFARVPGLTHRTPFGAARNGSASVFQDLDSLPLPAFHLTGELEGASSAPIEAGRGCPFACTFCSTNDFFRRKFRLKSPERLLADMSAIALEYGIRKFDLTHDMFTVDRKRLVEFCKYSIDVGKGFTWNCSARTDSIDEELLELMGEAGCTGIFLGIETGSKRMQQIIGKDLNIEEAKKVIDAAERLGIVTTVSLIAGFPEETPSDLQDSIDFFDFSLSHARSDPQLNLLSPLADTPIYSRYRADLTLEELCSDMSHQGRSHNEADRNLIRKYPDIFPNFYLLPTPFLDREFLFELREFLISLAAPMRWLFVALRKAGERLLDTFSDWRDWRKQIRPELGGWSLRDYYLLEVVRLEFVSFMIQHRRETPSATIDCFLSYHQAVELAKAKRVERPLWITSQEFTSNNIPVRKPEIHVFELSYDLQTALNALRCGQSILELDRQNRYFRTSRHSSGDLQLVETSAIIAAGLKACDGENSVGDCLQLLEQHFDGPPMTRCLTAECLLETLRSEGLIDVYQTPLALVP